MRLSRWMLSFLWSLSLSQHFYILSFFFLSLSLSLSHTHTHTHLHNRFLINSRQSHPHTSTSKSFPKFSKTNSFLPKRSNLLLIHLSLTDIIGSLFRPLIFLHLHQIISFCFCFLNCSFIFNCCEHLLKHTHESSYSHTLRLPPYTIFLSLTHKHTLSH